MFLTGHKREAFDQGALWLSILATCLFIAPIPVIAVICACFLAAVVPLPSAVAGGGNASKAGAGTFRKIGIILVTAALIRYGLGSSLAGLWFGVLWLVVPPFTPLLWRLIRTARHLRPLLTRSGRLAFRGVTFLRRFLSAGPVRPEVIRCLLLAAVGCWLMRGFLRPTLNGTADALWYGTMLADMVAQVRAGVFPVWLGQSIYQFNGAIYPLRVAPAFHYFGALLDALTFHSLRVFALQNLLLVSLGLSALACAYVCLRKLLAEREWLAFGLAVLFLSCPGVLGIAYNTDLYMSWTTVPFVPLIWFATVRSFQDRGSTPTLILLGAALGVTWWGHSPIALWSTLLAFGAQVARLACGMRDERSWMPDIAGAIAFILVAAYPVGSVLLFPPEPGGRADTFQRALPGVIVYFLHQAFPQTFLPLSPKARALGDFQCGYALWALLLLLALCWHRRARPECSVTAGAAALLAVMLLPIPGFDLAVWSMVPAFVRDTTGNWVMNRLYLPLAAATVFGAAAFVSTGLCRSRRARLALSTVVSLGCVWSLAEARKFGDSARAGARAPESAVDLLRPENIQLTRFSYLVFPKLPSTFTHGVVDPEIENHLLARDSLATLSRNADEALKSGRIADSADFRGEDGLSEGYIGIGKKVHMEAGHSYLLAFDFRQPQLTGVLQLTGPHLAREYALPEYGGDRAFGAGGEHSRVLSVWSTSGPEDFSVHFVPVPALSAGDSTRQFGHVDLVEYDRNALPVRIGTWIPYSAHVRSTAAAWLETPRMFQTGYVATVDQRPAAVTKSPDGFVAVAVPAGDSEVTLAYVAPWGLRLLFWTSLLSATGLAALGVARCFHQKS